MLFVTCVPVCCHSFLEVMKRRLYECIHVSYCFPNRSSVPITKQANKNLILKATAEAEKSVSSAMDTVLKEEKMYSVKGKGSFTVQSTCTGIL